MTKTSQPPVTFTLSELCQVAEAIIESGVEATLAYRLQAQVLRLPAGDPAMRRLRAAARQSPWVRQLEQEQQADGSWGRFHSQDTKLKSCFRTTEEALDRALALGLDMNDSLLQRAHAYILAGLRGELTVSDPPEKNERWLFFLPQVLAGRLAQLDPTHPDLAPHQALWLEIAQRAFASGSYRLEDEAAAYPALAGIRAPQGFLESQYALWTLSSQKLPLELSQALVHWLWHKPDGIRYLRVSLAEPNGLRIGLWLRSLEILRRFSGWQAAAAGALEALWRQRGPDGRWEFGPGVLKSSDFPISTSWRLPGNRSSDQTTLMLILFKEFFDPQPSHLAPSPLMARKV